jgi:hypothetical protein
VLRARERASTPCSFAVFSLGLTFESFKELGARQGENAHKIKKQPHLEIEGQEFLRTWLITKRLKFVTDEVTKECKEMATNGFGVEIVLKNSKV